MRQYVDALPSGSYVVVAHFFDPGTDELSPLARRMEQVFLHSPMRSGMFRTRSQIEAFLPGLEVVPPGPGRPGELELCDLWWPDGPTTARAQPGRAVHRCSDRSQAVMIGGLRRVVRSGPGSCAHAGQRVPSAGSSPRVSVAPAAVARHCDR